MTENYYLKPNTTFTLWEERMSKTFTIDKEGSMSWVVKRWDKYGRMYEEYEVKKKKAPNITYKSWYENGTKCVECGYSDSMMLKLTGKYRKWYEDGKEWAEMMYDDGALKKIVYVKDRDGNYIERDVEF